MAGDKDRRLAGIKSAYKWYALAAVALAGNLFFEREAVQIMSTVQANQTNLAAAFTDHDDLPSHQPAELRFQRDETILNDLTKAVEDNQNNTADFMDTVNNNFIAIQTQINITALMSEKRDLVDRTEQLERVVERMELNAEVVPILYRQSIQEKRQDLININNTIAGLRL